MKFAASYVVGFAVAVAAAAPADAQNKCSDILVSGAVQNLDWKQNDYLQQIVVSRFLKSTFTSSKSDKALGMEIPIGEAVMGKADYSEAEFKAKQGSLEKSFSSQFTASREIDVALTSGDPVIVKAWESCMLQQGGPSVRFAAESGKEVFVHLEFHSAPNTRTRLTTALTFGNDVVVESGHDCLKAGAEIQARIGCIAVLTLPSAEKTLIAAINTEQGTATAYLPPRLSVKTERRPYRFSENCKFTSTGASDEEVKRCADRLYGYFHQRSAAPRYTLRLTDEELADGWTFDPSTARVQVSYLSRVSPSGMSHCHKPFSDPSATTFTYGYDAVASTRGNDKGARLHCVVEPAIEMTRTITVPLD